MQHTNTHTQRRRPTLGEKVASAVREGLRALYWRLTGRGSYRAAERAQAGQLRRTLAHGEAMARHAGAVGLDAELEACPACHRQFRLGEASCPVDGTLRREARPAPVAGNVVVEVWRAGKLLSHRRVDATTTAYVARARKGGR